MIDICMVVHKNYKLLEMQLEHLKRLSGGYRLLVADSTPPALRPNTLPSGNYSYFASITISDFDGISHGSSLDYLVDKAESDIVGIMDSDFFWTNKDILLDVEKAFASGVKCMGVSNFYPDFVRLVDPLYPERASDKAPCPFGMFIDRKLALEQTFVVNREEGAKYKETGWRLRERLVKENIPRVTFQGHSVIDDPECCYFTNDCGTIQGYHFLKGSSSRSHMIESLYQRYINVQ